MSLTNRKRRSRIGAVSGKITWRVGVAGFALLAAGFALLAAASAVALDTDGRHRTHAEENSTSLPVRPAEIRVAPPDLGTSFLDLEEVRINAARPERPPVIELPPIERIPLGPLAEARMGLVPAPVEVEAPEIAESDPYDKIAPIELLLPPPIQPPPLEGGAGRRMAP